MLNGHALEAVETSIKPWTFNKNVIYVDIAVSKSETKFDAKFQTILNKIIQTQKGKCHLFSDVDPCSKYLDLHLLGVLREGMKQERDHDRGENLRSGEQQNTGGIREEMGVRIESYLWRSGEGGRGGVEEDNTDKSVWKGDAESYIL